MADQKNNKQGKDAGISPLISYANGRPIYKGYVYIDLKTGYRIHTVHLFPSVFDQF